MKILHVALLLCLICYVFASEEHLLSLNKKRTSLEPIEDSFEQSYECQRIKNAIRDGNMDVAYMEFIINPDNPKLRDYCINSLIELSSSRIVELIKGAKDDVKAWMLQSILAHADQWFIDEVFGKLNLSNEVLNDVALNADVACIPDRFIQVLKKITTKENQEEAVEKGIFALYHGGKVECIDPLLSALEDKVFLNAGLRKVAIRKIFTTAAMCKAEYAGLARRLFDHPEISAEIYSATLYESFELGDPPKEFFYWLLKRADRQDLNAVKRNDAFSDGELEFRNAVNKALITATNGTRLGNRQAKVDVMKEAVAEGGITATQVQGIIGEFITEYTE